MHVALVAKIMSDASLYDVVTMDEQTPELVDIGAA